MEPLVIPPSPNWYESKIAVCSPDNTLIYGAHSAIVVIKPAPFDHPANISVISHAHSERIVALSLAPTWNEDHKLVVSVADDKIVKVWNLLDNTCVYSHKGHTCNKNRPVGVAFMNDTKVVSVSQDGFIIVWKMTTDEFTPYKHLLGVKANVTAMSTCPHGGWLTAFGMKSGLVIVVDLQGPGKILYKLRAHDRDVIDFAWCPSPTYVLPDKKREKEKSVESKCERIEAKIKEKEKPSTTEVDVHQTEDTQDTVDAMPANGTHIQCAIDQSQSHDIIDIALQNVQESMDIAPQESVDIIPAEENVDVPPQMSVDIPPQMSVDIPPQTSIDVPPESSVDITLGLFSDISSEKSSDIPPEKSSDISPKKSSDISPKKSSDISPKKSSDISPKKSSDIPPERSADLSSKKSLESMNLPPTGLSDNISYVQSPDTSPQKSESVDIPPKKPVDTPPELKTPLFKSYKRIEKGNLWVGLKHADDDEIKEEDKEKAETSKKSARNDYLNECLALKAEIDKLRKEELAGELPKRNLIIDASGDHGPPRKVLQANRSKKEVPQQDLNQIVPPQNTEVNTVEVKLRKSMVSPEPCCSTSKPFEDKSSLEKLENDELSVLDDSIEVLVSSEDVEVEEIILKGVTIDEVLREHTTKVEDILSPQVNLVNLVSSITNDTTDITKPAVQTEKPPKPEFLLASSARGGHFVIWRVGTDGRVQRRCRLSKPQTKHAYATRQMTYLWMTLHWISPDKLLTSGFNGEMLVWQVSDDKPTPKLVHSDHPKQLFCITSPFYHERGDFSKWEDLAAWTIGQDRSIFYTTLHTRRILISYPTFSCATNVMAASPIAPTRVAFGFSDGLIRFWDLSKPINQYIQMNQVKPKVGNKVTSLAWHYTQEFILAFGTDDGQVGFVNSSQYKKPTGYFLQHFLAPIHKLEWAPVPKKQKPGLYCCSSGALVIYDFDNISSNPTVIPLPKGDNVSHFSWKSDFSKLAVGCKNGTVLILDKEFNLETTLYYMKKSVISMVWHPMQTAEDEEQSPNYDWIACASSGDGPVVIFDLSKAKDHFHLNDVIAGELCGHVKGVSHVFWSPYKNGLAATVSEDGTAMVWKDLKPISTFLNNNAEPIISGMWSPVHENMIITSGRDCSLRIWNLLEHPAKEQSHLSGARTVRKHFIHHRVHKEEAKVVKAAKSKKGSLFGDLNMRQTNLETAVNDCRLMFEHFKGEKPESEEEENSLIKLFGDQKGIAQIIENQMELHKEKGMTAMNNYLSLWTGDIGEVIKKAMTFGTLTPWLVSITPMVSPLLWHEVVEAYCTQLADSTTSDPVEIASFYLAVHKPDKAIDILSAKQMFRDALVLAKLKKPTDLDLHKAIVTKWANSSEASGCYEVAAQSYISLGQFEEAARVLYKRTDLAALALGAELARHSGNATLADTIQYRHDMMQKGENVEKTPELPTRLELELESAKKNAQNGEMNLSALGKTDDKEIVTDKGDTHKDAIEDAVCNENSSGEVQNVPKEEENADKSDNKEVDGITVPDNEFQIVGVKTDDVGDVPDKNKEDIEHVEVEEVAANVVDTDSGGNVHATN